MTQEALKLALGALEVVTKELLAVRDELAERWARPKTNAFHQRLWDSSFKAYTDHALPAATAIKKALAQPEQPKVRTGDCLLVGVCASEGHKIQPQRTWVGLTEEQRINISYKANGNECVAVELTEAKLKELNT